MDVLEVSNFQKKKIKGVEMLLSTPFKLSLPIHQYNVDSIS